MTDSDVDFADERVAELYRCFSPHARASSPSLPAQPSAPATSMGDATTVVMAPVMQIMPELQQMCEEPVSLLLGEHIQGGSLVHSVVALAPAPTTPDPSQASLYEEKSCRDSSVMHSPKPIGLMVPVGEDIVVAGVVVPNPGALFAAKLCDFLAELDADKSGKTIGCLLKEKALRDKCKKGGINPRPGILKEKSSRTKSKKDGAKGNSQVVP